MEGSVFPRCEWKDHGFATPLTLARRVHLERRLEAVLLLVKSSIAATVIRIFTAFWIASSTQNSQNCAPAHASVRSHPPIDQHTRNRLFFVTFATRSRECANTKGARQPARAAWRERPLLYCLTYQSIYQFTVPPVFQNTMDQADSCEGLPAWYSRYGPNNGRKRSNSTATPTTTSSGTSTQNSSPTTVHTGHLAHLCASLTQATRARSLPPSPAPLPSPQNNPRRPPRMANPPRG